MGKNKEVARRIVSGYLNSLNGFSFEERVAELALITNDDERLLEHVNMMLEYLQAAKKELENDRQTH